MACWGCLMVGEKEPALMTLYRLSAQSGIKLRERSSRPLFNDCRDRGGTQSLQLSECLAVCLHCLSVQCSELN